MDAQEAHRLNTLAEIVGQDSVDEFAFYDDVDYDTLVATVTVTSTGAIPATLRDLRKLADIPLSEAKTALADRTTLCTVDLAQSPGCLERRWTIVRLEKMKQAIEQHGGAAEISLRTPAGDFTRKDCSRRELDYLKVRITTWM